MDPDGASAPAHAADGSPGSAKRKRSPSADGPPVLAAPPTKMPKTTSSSHLQINYLARQNLETLPLVSGDDAMPVVLQRLSEYLGVLDRHESLASNLGARPLGPILIQRFERLFDGQPRVHKTNGKDAGTVTWLDVVEFARQKPDQFNLEKSRDGVRVCSFYTKQSRVEISEDDFTLIASGLPQKLIPPQPISEDEEKELGTLEILDKRLGAIIQQADQVSARARQLRHRITSRRNAIASRREAQLLAEKAGLGDGDASPTETGFRAVNSNRPEKLNGLLPPQNSRSYTGATASPTTHAELLSCFNNNRQRMNDGREFASPTSAHPSGNGGTAKPKVKSLNENIDYAAILLSSASSPGPIASTPTTAQTPGQRPSQAERYDDSGPFKAEMLSRMENMARGERVMPPCDRCRRLHMDCLKNLTACLGCTKKHAKCSWKEVTDQELADHPFSLTRTHAGGDASARRGSGDDPLMSNAAGGAPVDDDPSQPVRDEELLGEDDSDDEVPISTPPTMARPISGASARAHSPAGSSPRDDGPISAAVSEQSPDAAATTRRAPSSSLPGVGGRDADTSAASSVEPLTSQDKVEQAARQILEKRLEERHNTTSNGNTSNGHASNRSVNGFRSVNRPVSPEPILGGAGEADDVANGVVSKPSVAA